MSTAERMRRLLNTKQGRERYKLRNAALWNLFLVRSRKLEAYDASSIGGFSLRLSTTHTGR